MRRRISLCMPIAFLLRRNLIELRADILNDAGIGMLINQNARSGMRRENITNTAFYPALFHDAFNPAGNLLELHPRIRLYVKFMYQISPHI